MVQQKGEVSVLEVTPIITLPSLYNPFLIRNLEYFNSVIVDQTCSARLEIILKRFLNTFNTTHLVSTTVAAFQHTHSKVRTVSTIMCNFDVDTTIKITRMRKFACLKRVI